MDRQADKPAVGEATGLHYLDALGFVFIICGLWSARSGTLINQLNSGNLGAQDKI